MKKLVTIVYAFILLLPVPIAFFLVGAVIDYFLGENFDFSHLDIFHFNPRVFISNFSLADLQIAKLLGYIGIAVAVHIFLFATRQIVRKYHARLLKEPEKSAISPEISQLCAHLKLKVPRLYISPIQTSCALVAQNPFQRGTLIFTRGLLENLSTEQIIAVVSFLLIRIKRGDALIATIASSVNAGVINLAELIGKVVSDGQGKKKNRLLPISVNPSDIVEKLAKNKMGILRKRFANTLVRFARFYARKVVDEDMIFFADHYAVKLLADPSTYVNALKQLDLQANLWYLPTTPSLFARAGLCITDPYVAYENDFLSKLPSQPELKLRLEELNYR